MTFMLTSDEFYDLYVDEKGLSGGAVAVHLMATIKSIRQRSDGIIRDAKITTICRDLKLRGKPKIVAELIDAGLWEDLGNGEYRIDWTHQKTADQVERDRSRATERNADYRERDSRCKAGDHSMCAGMKRKCQQRDTVTNSVDRTPPSSPLPSSPFLSVPARDKDMDKDLEGRGGDINNLGTPTTDQPHLAFGHHPDSGAPSGALSPEAVLWSAPAVGVDLGDPVVPSDSRSDEGSGVEGNPVPDWPEMTNREAAVRAVTELDITDTKTGVCIRLSREAWAVKQKYDAENYPLWLHSARDVALLISGYAEKRLGAKTTTPTGGMWPMKVDHPEMSLTRIGEWMSELLDDAEQEAQSWRVENR